MGDEGKAQWEVLEDWLFDQTEEHGPDLQFHSSYLAKSKRISGPDASMLIQAYLDAQRRPNSTTLYVLKRETGRTSAAVWSVGIRTVDARTLSGTLHRDIVVKVRRAYEPDMVRLADRNPRARRFVNTKIEAVVAGVLPIIASALDPHFGEDDEE